MFVIVTNRLYICPLYYFKCQNLTMLISCSSTVFVWKIQEVCKNYGGDLVSVKTSAENRFILESVLNDCKWKFTQEGIRWKASVLN